MNLQPVVRLMQNNVFYRHFFLVFGVSTALAFISKLKIVKATSIGLAISLGIILIGYFCYIIYKEDEIWGNNNDEIRRMDLQKEIENLTKEKCILFTSCEVVKNEKRFEYDDWMDLTDLVDIKSKIESSLRLFVKFEIEFDNVETEQSYKDHVEQFSKEVRDNCGEENGEIATALNVEIGSTRNERLFDNSQIFDSFEYKMLQQFNWIIELIYWSLKMMYYDKTETIIIKKIITNKPSIRVITNYS